jgi:ATP-binding cassette subfamily B protein
VLVFTTITLLRNKLKTLHKQAQKTDGSTRSFMQECIENLLAIKVFSANENVSEKSGKLQRENFRIKMKRRNYSVFGHATYNMIFSAGYIFALIFGVFKIVGGSLDYGSLLAILQLVNNVQVPFASLSNIVPKYFAMTASAERLIEIEDVKEEQKKKPIDKVKVYDDMQSVVFDGVSFTYDRNEVLSKTSLEIKKGDFVAITGISGIGKSTLMKLLLGVYQPLDGKIYLKGKFGEIDIDNSTRSLFSFVPQGNLIFSGSIRDNLLFTGSNATDDEIYDALKISGAHEFVSSLPEGLDTYIGERGLGLSEGQVQRIAIARAMLSKASFLLFDEATSALDETTEKEILTNLKNLQGVTLIIISHKKSALSICNRHVSIEDGCIKEAKI